MKIVNVEKKDFIFPALNMELAEQVKWTASGDLSLKSDAQRFWGWVVPPYYCSKVEKVAQAVLGQLRVVHQKKSFLSREQTTGMNELVGAVVRLKPSEETVRLLEQYRRAISASRGYYGKEMISAPAADPQLEDLGLTRSMQVLYPDLVEMMRENDLPGFMKTAGLRIGRSKKGQPLFPMESGMMKWERAREQIFGHAPSGDRVLQNWRLISSGLQNVGMGSWQELTPCRYEEPHLGHYYVDLMSTTAGLNHCWVRLVDEQGRMASAGLCGKIYRRGLFRGSIASINSPDYREFSPEPHRQTRIEITQSDYLALKEKIENDQKDRNVYFNLLTRNCTAYACEVLSTIGLQIKNREYPTQIGIRKLLTISGLEPPEFLVKVMSSLASCFRPILGAAIAIFMGAWYEDPEVAELEVQYASHWPKKPNKPFRSWRSFFDGTNGQMVSSFKVVDWQYFVDHYRKKRLEFLQSQKEQIDSQIRSHSRFSAEWEALEHRIRYEMPPGLTDSHLFLHQLKKTPTGDVSARIGDLIDRLRNC